MLLIHTSGCFRNLWIIPFIISIVIGLSFSSGRRTSIIGGGIIGSMLGKNMDKKYDYNNIVLEHITESLWERARNDILVREYSRPDEYKEYDVDDLDKEFHDALRAGYNKNVDTLKLNFKPWESLSADGTHSENTGVVNSILPYAEFNYKFGTKLMESDPRYLANYIDFIKESLPNPTKIIEEFIISRIAIIKITTIQQFLKKKYNSIESEEFKTAFYSYIHYDNEYKFVPYNKWDPTNTLITEVDWNTLVEEFEKRTKENSTYGNLYQSYKSRLLMSRRKKIKDNERNKDKLQTQHFRAKRNAARLDRIEAVTRDRNITCTKRDYRMPRVLSVRSNDASKEDVTLRDLCPIRIREGDVEELTKLCNTYMTRKLTHYEIKKKWDDMKEYLIRVKLVPENFDALSSKILDDVFDAVDKFYWRGSLNKLICTSGNRLEFRIDDELSTVAGSVGNIKICEDTDARKFIFTMAPWFVNIESFPKTSMGIPCHSKLDCFLNIVCHESIHLYLDRFCAGKLGQEWEDQDIGYGHDTGHGVNFRTIALNMFGQTEYTHDLLTGEPIRDTI
jgi:hypothetical protein